MPPIVPPIVKGIFGNASSATAIAQFNSFDGIQKYPFKRIPEFLFAGRANVGKSSLINALMSTKKLVRSSSKAGATKTLNFYAPGAVGRTEPPIYLVDGPGYGLRGRPEWGNLFTEYASKRSTLCRIFLLICLSHGLKDSDREFLKELDELVMQSTHDRDRLRPLSYQVIFTKTDAFKDISKLSQTAKLVKKDIWDIAPTCLPETIFTSSTTSLDPGTKFGVDRLRVCIAEAGGFI